jgi:hypothetical protein
VRDRHEQAEQQNEGDDDEDLRCHAGVVVVHLSARLAADWAPALDYRTRTMCAY